MRQYTPGNIRNVALAGHGGSGKTSLAEAMLFFSKATDRLGKIADGNTVCDCDPEEIKRKASLNIALAPLEYENTKINLIDTPGLFDFAGGMAEGIRAAGNVLIVLSGKSGVTFGAKKAYKQAEGKSRAFFVSKLDNENADFYKVLEQLKAAFGPSVCPLVVPYVEEHKVQCYIDLLKMKAYRYDGSGKAAEAEMPDIKHRYEGLIAAISEAVAETDETLFEKYFSGEEFTQDELTAGVKKGIKDGSITPVFCGSAATLDGVDLLLHGIVKMFSSAEESAGEIVESMDGEPLEIRCSTDDPAAAFVFKTIADPFVGKMSYVKVVSGRLKNEQVLLNTTTGEPQKIGKILMIRGKKQEEVQELTAGDIGVLTKLDTKTGDSLCDEKRPCRFESYQVPRPCYTMAIATQKGEESKVASGLHRLLEEDLTLAFEVNNETHQQLLTGLGEQHLDVAVAKLKSKFGVNITLEAPIIAYRETIRKKVKVEGKHKKQTGGHGQFGHVWIEFEPYDGEDLLFEEKIFGGAVPKGFFPAVEKGLRDCIQHGVLAGYPVVGLKATLVDGSYHPVDSSEMSFKMAATLAYKAGLPQASPVLLEPIGALKVYVPDNNTGDMMGELNKRRGRVLGMTPQGDNITLIEAEVPNSEMQDFTMLVRQMTQGSGWFTFDFERYEQLPSNLEAEVIENARKLFENN